MMYGGLYKHIQVVLYIYYIVLDNEFTFLEFKQVLSGKGFIEGISTL